MYSLPLQDELSEEDKLTIENTIKRDSPEDKVKALLDWIDVVRKDVKHIVSVVSTKLMRRLREDYKPKEMMYCSLCYRLT